MVRICYSCRLRPAAFTDKTRMTDAKRMPECKCLNCGKPLNAVSEPHKGQIQEPSEGAATVCLGCGHIMIITQDLLLREPTGEEMVELAGDPELLEVMSFVAKYQEWKREREAESDGSEGSTGESAAGGES